MKKIISVALVLIMALSLCACETPQEKAARRIKEATAAYQREAQKLEDLESELEYVQWQIEQAEKNN